MSFSPADHYEAIVRKAHHGIEGFVFTTSAVGTDHSMVVEKDMPAGSQCDGRGLPPGSLATARDGIRSSKVDYRGAWNPDAPPLLALATLTPLVCGVGHIRFRIPPDDLTASRV
jgi:hypothetical protein